VGGDQPVPEIQCTKRKSVPKSVVRGRFKHYAIYRSPPGGIGLCCIGFMRRGNEPFPDVKLPLPGKRR
jgi:hypothetical protein